MIQYVRAVWYGFHYLLYFKGTLLPRLWPMVLLSGALSMIISRVATGPPDDDGKPTLEPWLLDLDVCVDITSSHPYAYQLFGIVFGYLCISRLNMSYNRYACRYAARTPSSAPPVRAHARLRGRTAGTVGGVGAHEAHALQVVRRVRPSHRLRPGGLEQRVAGR